MDEKSNTPEKAKQGRKPRQSKVKEVQSDTVVDEKKFIPKKKIINEYPVIINGVERLISKPTFKVLSKDPVNFKIEVPKDSPLVEPIANQPCRNC